MESADALSVRSDVLTPIEVIALWRRSYPGRWGADVAGLAVALIAGAEAEERRRILEWLRRECDAGDDVLGPLAAGAHRDDLNL